MYTKIEFRDFLNAYIEAALFSSNDYSREDGGDPLDDNYSAEDLTSEAHAAAAFDCAAFLARASDLIDSAECTRGTGEYSKYAQAGHDFWMTRNGHGVGFWDGDWSTAEGEALTALCGWRTSFGEVNLSVNDGTIDYDAPSAYTPDRLARIAAFRAEMTGDKDPL